jgi:hypothetical protein
MKNNIFCITGDSQKYEIRYLDEKEDYMLIRKYNQIDTGMVLHREIFDKMKEFGFIHFVS